MQKHVEKFVFYRLSEKEGNKTLLMCKNFTLKKRENKETKNRGSIETGR